MNPKKSQKPTIELTDYERTIAEWFVSVKRLQATFRPYGEDHSPAHDKTLDRLWAALPYYKKMQAIRVASDTPQSEAAEIAGISRTALSHAENHKRRWFDIEDDLIDTYISRIRAIHEAIQREQDHPEPHPLSWTATEKKSNLEQKRATITPKTGMDNSEG